MKHLKKIVPCLCVLCISITTLFAQPANDNCANASVISIASGGFGFGSFPSATSDITSATVQTGETFAPAIFASGEDQKSVWYKFTLPTTRSVKVTLLQPGTDIPADGAGFAVYKTDSCLPGQADLSTKFTPISRFSSSYHPCVESGDYLIQVSSKSTADGPISIELDIYDSTGAQYDHPKEAYDFGTITNQTLRSDFSIECQSIEDATETCPALANSQLYTKSTWHTFTTPAYFDYLTVMLSSANCQFVSGSNTFGYTLYKGDVKTTEYKTLPKVSACDSFVTGGYYADYKVYKCEDLEPNTTYSVQLFYKTDFQDQVRLSVGTAGTHATQAPQPILSKLPASNTLGILPGDANGNIYETDYFGCNSRDSIHACNPSLPAKGFSFNNTKYNLSTFYTFQLKTSANISLSASTNNCGFPVLMRLYNQNLTNDCTGLDTANILEQGERSIGANCLPAGTYTLQLSGSDSMQPYNYFTCNSDVNCQLSNLGQQINITISTKYVNAANKYSLQTNGAYDPVNAISGIMKALRNDTTYQAAADTFGCNNTVLPPAYSETYCDTTDGKAIYHEFVIGDANGDSKPDSGVVTIGAYYATNNGRDFNTAIYKGDANALAQAQNAHKAGDTIQNLIPFTECFESYCNGNANFCVTPGTYSVVTLGNDNHVGIGNQPSLTFNIVTTLHHDGATAQNMGSILDTLGINGGSITSDKDYFSCTDNAVTINGNAPPGDPNGLPTTKAIYRQFYLNAPAVVSICNPYYYYDCNNYNGPVSLFSGKASDGLKTLTLVQSTTYSSSCITRSACAPLSAGWYTIVSYGSGPTYDKPFQNINGTGGYGSAIGHYSQFTITVTIACAAPQFNHPRNAAIDTTTKQPFLLEWKLRSGSTAAYPVTDTTYTLYTENFNCALDTPFTIVKPCNANVNRVAYYVFKISQESYIQINTQSLWGEVFAGDARTDSASFKTATPIQPCIQSSGYIQLCRLQPGTYTLVMFAGDNNVSNGCGSVVPTIYIDATGYSRFDNAKNAYDFGTIPSDSVYYNGKPGDVNPLNSSRAASNDFFYCTTGSRQSDPTESTCGVEYNPNVYNTGVNNHFYDSSFLPTPYNVPRRNLWYTFVVDKPGNVHVKVLNVTSRADSSTYHYPFAIYKSDVNGSLPFSTVVSNGQVDSTVNQGLSIINYNLKYNYYYLCYTIPEEITFYRDPCSPDGPTRYYVVADDVNSNSSDVGLKPNSQVEVSVMLDTVNAIATKFDHYYEASNIGIVGAGDYKAATDNYTCATADATDPIQSYQSCAQKTLWYKFTPTVTGHVKYRLYIDSVVQSFSAQDIQLFRQTTPGDSTSAGLSYINSTSYYDNTTNSYWGENCVSPGTYYLIMTGCNRSNEFEFPEIQIDEEAGDFCSAPVVTAINGAGGDTASVTVDCHTIGTDYGEFGPTLSCPVGAKTSDYKSSWFRMDIGGKDTLDVTVYLDQHTNAQSDQIQYRKMTGDCSAMQEESCVQDSRTQNTYRCLLPGKSYYIQVFTPVVINYYTQVTGNIDLITSSVKHADTCAPDANCLSIAKFIPQFDCTTDDSVKFINYSTYGSGIQYKWDFGYNNQTSSEVSPSFFYPALSSDKQYNVKLSLVNNSCGGQDSSTVPLTIPARPYVNLGKDITACNYDTVITLHATSFDSATYTWNYGSTDSTYNIPYKGQYQYSVEVDYKNCVSRDTINVYVNPVQKQALQSSVVCPGDSVQLYNNYYNSSYTWNTGETNYYIYAKEPGTYWTDIQNNGCTVRDSFAVSGVGNTNVLGNDTTICFSSGNNYTLNASVTGASYYQWQDGSSNAQYPVTKPGIYWVDIHFSSCTVRDSIVISSGTPPNPVIAGLPQFCSGDSTLLNAGNNFASYLWSSGDTTRMISVKSAGDYTVTVTDSNGCSNTSSSVSVIENPLPQPHISGNTLLCNVSSVTLSLTESYPTYEWSNGDVTQATTVTKPGSVSVTVTDNNGCKGIDSVTIQSGSSPATDSLATVICSGNSYLFPSGKKISMTGIYSDTLQSASGCDSLITTVHLSVLSPVLNSLSASICKGSSYLLPSGKAVSEPNIYTDTLHSSLGCDSLITTVNLQIISFVTVQSEASICQGSVYTLPGGKQVNAAGVYTDTLQSTLGCDSLIRSVILSVLQPATSELSASVCSGHSYTLPSGKTVTGAGNYVDTLYSTAGCDSLLITVHLSLLSSLADTASAIICPGASYLLPSGKKVSQAGIYTDTLHNSLGCDSLITSLNLSVSPPAVSADIASSVCAGNLYTLPSGKRVSAAGTYSDTLRNMAGCDSVLNSIRLSVITAGKQTSAAVFCLGQSYTLPWGKTVSAAGIYADTLHSSLGCDSIIQTLSLSVVSPLARSVEATLCPGQSYVLPSGKAVSTTGIYSDTLRSSMGCDSIITKVTLSETPAASTQNITATICKGETYTLPSGLQVSGDGNYRDTVKGKGSCDSLITVLALSVQPKPAFGVLPVSASVCAGDSVLLSASGGGSYNWSPATGLSSSLAQTVWAYPAQTTTYRAIITDRECRDSLYATVTVNPAPVLSITKSNDISCLYNQVQLNVSGGTTYTWSPADSTLQNPFSSNPIVRPAVTTVYYVLATSGNGCTSEGNIEVKVIKDNPGGYELPTAFTPNGDGKNDCFGVSSWGMISNLHFSVFDRTGRLLFTTKDPAKCWDGTLNGQPMPPGTYVYEASANTNCGFVFRKNTIVLIR